VNVDLNKCPNCNGPADNGHDRCFPPNPYYCSLCMEVERKKYEEDDLCEGCGRDQDDCECD
jgi:hypothetical protein